MEAVSYHLSELTCSGLLWYVPVVVVHALHGKEFGAEELSSQSCNPKAVGSAARDAGAMPDVRV